jgi:hypothetical protein
VDWRVRWGIYLAASVPAFTGWPSVFSGRLLLPGLDADRLLYAVAVNAMIGLLNGGAFLSGVLSAAAVVLLPLVFAGGSISFLVHLLGLAYPGGPPDYSPHYLSLAVNMLGVIPLGVGLVLNLPFARFEASLLGRDEGVSRTEKYLLMVVRVFNHIAFSVIPAALEVIREERWGLGGRRGAGNDGRPRRGRGAVPELVHLASTCISQALRFIPLWAMEIADLPERGGRPRRPPETGGEGGGNP